MPIDESILRDLGFTDHVPSQWYRSYPLNSSDTLDVTIVKESGEISTRVIDNMCGQYAPYTTHYTPESCHQVITVIDYVTSQLRARGIPVEHDHGKVPEFKSMRYTTTGSVLRKDPTVCVVRYTTGNTVTLIITGGSKHEARYLANQLSSAHTLGAKFTAKRYTWENLTNFARYTRTPHPENGNTYRFARVGHVSSGNSIDTLNYLSYNARAFNDNAMLDKVSCELSTIFSKIVIPEDPEFFGLET